jgi:hypothetical protein
MAERNASGSTHERLHSPLLFFSDCANIEVMGRTTKIVDFWVCEACAHEWPVKTGAQAPSQCPKCWHRNWNGGPVLKARLARPMKPMTVRVWSIKEIQNRRGNGTI